MYAQVLDAEDALVRHTFVSGTHALSVALFGVLRPGDKLLAVTGKPYDTLEEVIGISGTPGNGSLMDYGVEYGEVPLTGGGCRIWMPLHRLCPGQRWHTSSAPEDIPCGLPIRWNRSRRSCRPCAGSARIPL